MNSTDTTTEATTTTHTHAATARTAARRQIVERVIQELAREGKVATRRSLTDMLRGLGVRIAPSTLCTDLAALGYEDQTKWPRQYVRVAPRHREKRSATVA
jgi:hypothetical protein